ncbi:unnamed protein product [Soboliphyme baturini]|uniref:ANK_REP_REGION domain-containing protein n=1 Tax=Soboliphyme baturini TaxID=241478 RepID=A0A183ISQ7_9BILA|nr:unnamed protein product [Soboliphyme baturini]
MINDADANIVNPSDGNSPLHVAVAAKNIELVHTLLHVQGALKTNAIDLNILNKHEESPLELALISGCYDIASELINSGANIDVQDSCGNSVLLRCLMNANVEGCLRLIKLGASGQKYLCKCLFTVVIIRNSKGMSPLLFAVSKGYTSVVSALCSAGAATSVRSDKYGEDSSILWTAIQAGYNDVATVLVQSGKCDVDFWCAGPNGCYQTLLHKALDENNEAAACFLIRNNCNVHALRKLGPKGEGREEVDEKDTPLHMAAAWGLRDVVIELLAHGADVNAQDKMGRTPLHIAVENQHLEICRLLLDAPNVNLYIRTSRGLTPMHFALKHRNNKIAEIIVKKDKHIFLQVPVAIALGTVCNGDIFQVDNKGYNPLHNAAATGDMETILLLLSLQIDVRAVTQDEEKLSALHLAVKNGDEMMVRTLILAGADVNGVSSRKQSVLHISALNDRPQICSILLEKGADCNAVDSYLHNALHLAVQVGSLGCVKVLLQESSVDALALNLKGHSPLHLLGIYGKENAAAIFQCFVANIPNYPVDTLDPEGNTGWLCLAEMILIPNRHCGRLLCGKCSENSVLIMKYKAQKPLRVCSLCCSVLTFGVPT